MYSCTDSAAAFEAQASSSFQSLLKWFGECTCPSNPQPQTKQISKVSKETRINDK